MAKHQLIYSTDTPDDHMLKGSEGNLLFLCVYV